MALCSIGFPGRSVSGCVPSNCYDEHFMAIELAKDFREFLKSLNSKHVEYLLIGGYAVAVYGHIRATNYLDVWVNMTPENAVRIEQALRDFGFASTSLTQDLFLSRNNIIRMGVPPIRIEILTSISGVEFDQCYQRKKMIEIEDILVPVISLPHLRQNKAASGRAKDLADLESLADPS